MSAWPRVVEVGECNSRVERNSFSKDRTSSYALSVPSYRLRAGRETDLPQTSDLIRQTLVLPEADRVMPCDAT